MKKLLLSLAAVAMTATLSAEPLYFCGEFQSWDPANPVVVNPGADGSYEFTMSDLAKFKMSTAMGDWDTFNAGALGTTETMTAPGTFSLVTTGLDQVLPWTGEWTVKVDAARTSMTITTTTPKPDGVQIYLRGTMNGWNSPADWQFTTTDGDLYELKDVTIAQSDKFKVADANWGSINYGGANGMVPGQSYTLFFNANDCDLAVDFTGDVKFRLSTLEILFEAHEITPPQPISKELYIVGDNYGNWTETAEEYHFTKSENVYTLVMPNGIQGEWKIWNGTWNYTFGQGGEPIVLGSNEVWFDSSSNFSLNTLYETTVVLTVDEGSDVKNSGIPATMTVTEKQDGVSEIENPFDGTAEYFTLQGVRVDNPTDGNIYIVRRGGKVAKILK